MQTKKLTLTHLQRSEWRGQLNAMSGDYPVRDTLWNMEKNGAQTAIQVDDNNRIVAFFTMMPGVQEGDAVGLIFGNGEGATETFTEEAMRLFGHKVLRMQVPQKHFHATAERLGIIKNFTILHYHGDAPGNQPTGVELVSGDMFEALSGEDIVQMRRLLEYAVSVEEKHDRLKREHAKHYDSSNVIKRMKDFGFFSMVYRVEGEVVGMIAAQAGSQWVEVCGLAVSEEHQRKGVGTN